MYFPSNGTSTFLCNYTKEWVSYNFSNKALAVCYISVNSNSLISSPSAFLFSLSTSQHRFLPYQHSHHEQTRDYYSSFFFHLLRRHADFAWPIKKYVCKSFVCITRTPYTLYFSLSAYSVETSEQLPTLSFTNMSLFLLEEIIFPRN